MYKQLSLLMALGYIGIATSATTNYDILGRKGSKMNTPMVYRNVDYSKTKKNDIHNILAKQAETKIAKASGALKHTDLKLNGCSGYTLTKSYWFNDKEMNQSKYFDMVNAYEESYAPRINYNGYGEQQEKKNYNTGFNFTYGDDFKPNRDNYEEASRYEKNVTTNYRDIQKFSNWDKGVSHIYSYSDLDRFSFSVRPSYSNQIGVYLASDASSWYTNAKVYNKCEKNSLVWNLEATDNYLSNVAVLRRFSNNMDLIFYDHNCDIKNGAKTQFPVRPDQLPIHMGVHTNDLNEIGDGSYNDRAAYLDDYIYENRMIEIVAAGNLAKTPTKDNYYGYTRMSASALNAITVGAVEQSTKKVAAYTGWKNPKYVSGEKKSFDKPEIYGFTNFFSRDKKMKYKYASSGVVRELNPTHGGTETAAAYIGGMVESLLSSEPFYKWHPEVVKALLLTSSDIDVMPKDKKGKIDYVGNDFIYNKDNKNLVIGLTDYAKVFVGNTSRYWIANNSGEIMKDKEDGKPYFTFKEKVNGNHLRIAISWLSKSSYAVSKGRTPQDFDLYVYDENGKEVGKSTTGDNPFELVDVKLDTGWYTTITIKIKLHRDDGERILLGYNLFDYWFTSMEGCPVGL